MPENRDRSSHQLIEGEFSAAEARTILMTLIENKIRFHQRKHFSEEERLGRPDEYSNRRIDQLLQTKSDVAALIDSAEEDDAQLAINCVIEIERISK